MDIQRGLACNAFQVLELVFEKRMMMYHFYKDGESDYDMGVLDDTSEPKMSQENQDNVLCVCVQSSLPSSLFRQAVCDRKRAIVHRS